MNVSPGDRLIQAIDLVSDQVQQMREGDWARPTPCDGWDAHQLLDHVSDTLTGLLGSMAGGDYRASKHGEAGRLPRPAESVERWKTLAAEGREAAAGIDPDSELSGPMGSGPAEAALRIPTHDLTVHAWDLAASAVRDLELPEPLRADLDDLVHGMPVEMVRSPGLFGPEVEAPAAAGPTARLMAFLGRRRPA